MNSPQVMNALSVGLFEELGKAWTRFAEDDDAWVAVLTGAGDKAFCAGADLKEMNENNMAGVKRHKSRGGIPPCTPRMLDIGWWMAQDCDMVVADETAQLGVTESLWNLPAPWAADLTSRISIRHVIEVALCLSASPHSAPTRWAL